MAEYKVKFEVFEGPLDLLLYLIKKEEVDIYEVNLTRLATQFIEYIETLRMLDLEVAGEFLVMAATLMYIKSRELLPVEQQAQVEEEETEDPRWELIRQLVEYKKFKDAAARLQELEARQETIFPRLPIPPHFEAEPDKRSQASLFDLVNAVNTVLQRFNKPEYRRDIYEEKFSVSEKIDLLMRLTDGQKRLKFSDLFAGVSSRAEVIVTFLAMLELIRLKQITAVQGEAFGEIDLCRVLEPLAGAPRMLGDDGPALEPAAEPAPSELSAPPAPSDPSEASEASEASEETDDEEEEFDDEEEFEDDDDDEDEDDDDQDEVEDEDEADDEDEEEDEDSSGSEDSSAPAPAPDLPPHPPASPDAA